MITLFPLIFLLLIVDALTMTNVTVYNPQSLIEQIKSLYPKSNSCKSLLVINPITN